MNNKYARMFAGQKLDVYRILQEFDVACPVAQHVLKKALCAGQRGHKDVRQDWQDIADSAARKLEMLAEDGGQAEEPGAWLEWPGGQCPVPDTANIEIRFRDGRGLVGVDRPWSAFDWKHYGIGGDIVALRWLP